jgi:hypothetical protein
MTVWALALVWSVTAAYIGGYGRDPADMALILGMPDWVFWSVAAPWGVCLLFSTWFCFRYVADDPLGADAADEPASAERDRP